MGDIIFSLPTIRALGGGILYLDPEGGKSEPLVIGTDQIDKTKLNKGSIDSLKPLLEAQPYIERVDYYSGNKVDYNLDTFRKHVRFNNLADSHLEAFRLPHKERDKAWITINEEKIAGKSTIITRSTRYQGNHAFWAHLCQKENLDACIFLGHEKEHDIFEWTFNVKIDYVKTPTLVDACKLIAGAEKVYCNQSALHAMAEAMKKPLVQEVFRPYPATLFKRSDATYV
jgi:hypothetical protein